VQQGYDDLGDDIGNEGVAFAEWVGWFDLMGFQRHIKVLGIFSRLCFRDGKPQYLEDLPTVLAYVAEALNLYREQEPRLAVFAEWFEADLMPRAALQPWCRAE